MNPQPGHIFFSIVMPVYNVEAFVEDAIKSILDQSFTDLELIVVNDGSTDNSVAIAERLAAQDTRIKIVHKKNGGLSSARNEGIKNATGQYIHFMDSDDTLRADALQSIYTVIKDHRPDMVAFTAMSYLDERFPPSQNIDADISSEYFLRTYLDEGLYKAKDYFEITSGRQNFVVSACLFVVPLALLKNKDLWFFEGIIHEDELFTRQLIMECQSVFFLKQPFYERRLRYNSITNSVVSPDRPYSFLRIGEELDKLHEKFGHPLLKERSESFFYRAIGILKTFTQSSPAYKKVLKDIFQSPLAKKYKIGFIEKFKLQYKQVDRIKASWKSWRYKLGLRTRLKKLFHT